MIAITTVDMHLRDERLYDWLKSRDGKHITYSDIAMAFNCHKLTAKAMVKRLRQADLITIEGSPYNPKGYTYRITKCKENSA